MERILTIIDQQEAEKLLAAYGEKKKRGVYAIEHTEQVNIPYYILQIDMSIKRAFGLKPKVIQHVYWVNTIDGTMIRTKENPEKELLESGKVVPQQLSRKQCFKIAEDQAFKHVTRFYKSFWMPELELKEKDHLCIGYWKFTVKFQQKEEDQIILINSFSGDVAGHLKKSQEIYGQVM